MRSLALLALVGASLTGEQARAQSSCPWITTGTVAKELEAEVTLTTKLKAAGEGSCVFRADQAAVRSVLEVEVSSARLRSCPEGSERLKGIGSEAVICEAGSEGSGGRRLLVESRVREVYFRVSLESEKTGGAGQIKGQREVITQVAEQVAGNLF